MVTEKVNFIKTENTKFLQDLKKVLKKHNVEIVVKIDDTVFKLTERGEESFIYKNK